MPAVMLILVALAALVVGLSGIPLQWDGSYLLFQTLNDQTPFIALGRVPMALFESPALLLSRITEDMGVLRTTFGLSYAAVPFLALLLSWLIVRSRAPHLIIWPALSILGITLFAELFTVNEGLIVAQLTWPLWLLAATSSGRKAGALLLLGAVILLRLHPTGLLATGVAALITCFRDRRLAIALSVLMLLQVLAPKDPYEVALLTGAKEGDGLGLTFLRSVVRIPGVSAVALWFLGASLIVARPGIAKSRFQALARFAPMPLIGLVVVLAVYWASNPLRWLYYYDLRLWVLILSLPLAGFMIWESRQDGRPGDLPLRNLVATVAAAGFLIVLSLQGMVIYNLTERLKAVVLSTPPQCVVEQTIPWLSQSPLYSWSMPAHSMLLQSRAPASVILWMGDCASPQFAREIPGSPSASWKRDSGWFDLRRTGLGPITQ